MRISSKAKDKYTEIDIKYKLDIMFILVYERLLIGSVVLNIKGT